MGSEKIRKKKIAIIGVKGLPAFGGSARAGENLVLLLKEKYHFTVYNTSSHTTRRSGDYDGIEQIVFRRSIVKKLNTFMYYLKCLFHCLLFRNYDIVHVFHLDASFIIPVLRLRFKVVAAHRARPQESSKWSTFAKFYFNVMEYIFYKFPGNAIISNSKEIVKKYQDKTGKVIQYIPNGINFESLKTEIPLIKYKDYILFAAARIMETKGCHIFLEALIKIDYKGLIIIIGSHEHDKKYINLIKELSSKLNVVFTGLITDKNLLMSYIKNAKIAVYPTFLEGMSNMLLEIAAMNTPLICSDIQENTIVFDEKEVLHFKNKDSDDLAIKMQWALENCNKMKDMSKRAYAKLKFFYNWKIIAEQYDQLYQSLLK